jgi:ribosomal protein S14
MSNSIQGDKKRRKLHLKYELKRIEYKSLISTLTLQPELRTEYLRKLNKLPRNSSVVRIKNRCILTGRGHSVYKFCRLSRIKLRELASQGVLMGISKSSW